MLLTITLICSDPASHLNVYGQKKVSIYFANFLSGEYNLPNHRADSSIASEWDKLYIDYQKYLELLLANQAD